MGYVDGFVLVVPKKRLPAYRRMALQGKKLWMKYGALEYRECVAEDLRVHPGCGVPYPKLLRLAPGETVVFAWIVYKSRAHRDRVNAKVMKDPSLVCPPEGMPFDVARMSVGGFRVLVEAKAR